LATNQGFCFSKKKEDGLVETVGKEGYFEGGSQEGFHIKKNCRTQEGESSREATHLRGGVKRGAKGQAKVKEVARRKEEASWARSLEKKKDPQRDDIQK